MQLNNVLLEQMKETDNYCFKTGNTDVAYYYRATLF